MTPSKIFSGMNPQQRQAVSAGDGPVLVLAGPGSGKTRVLTHRIAYLVQERGVRAWHILAVTFTNKAAREMENRVVGLLGGSGQLDGLSIGTFHSICARILRLEADYTPFSRDYVIFDTDDQLAPTVVERSPGANVQAVAGAEQESTKLEAADRAVDELFSGREDAFELER